MRISIFTTITNPEKRQDAYLEAIKCYSDFAYEVIIVDGGSTDGSLEKIVEQSTQGNVFIYRSPWPEDWSWEELPKHLNYGLSLCTGDWAIRADIDYFFHENDFEEINRRLKFIPNRFAFAYFQKFCVVPRDKYYQKGQIPIAINRNWIGDGKQAFGADPNAKSDLCYPIITAREFNDKGVMLGKLADESVTARTGVPVWNFDSMFKTKDAVAEAFYKNSHAYTKYFGESAWGDSPEKSLAHFIEMKKGFSMRAEYKVTDPNIYPVYVREKMKNLTPEQFGYNGWGEIL